MNRDPETLAACDRLLAQAFADGPADAIDYRLAPPKWQFLCHAADRGDIVLHGSGEPDISQFTPRQPGGTGELSGHCAVFAALDGIWPMCFAILDRARYSILMCNDCVRVAEEGGEFGEPNACASSWA